MAAAAGVDLEQCLEAAVAAAKAAGAIIRDGQTGKRAFDVSNKVGLDLVTDVDQSAEKTILEMLKPKFVPLGHKFIAEETASLEPLTDAPTWCIDPLDGTVNFVKSFPYSCVSIGLVVDQVCAMGVIYMPAHDELYTAVQGKGAFLNGERLTINTTTRLEDAMVITNISSNRNKHFVDTTMACIRTTLDDLGSIRSLGSAAMCMAYVARGMGDCYWELLVGGPWDFAAGACLITEAGGVTMDVTGAPWDLNSRRVMCGVKEVCDILAPRLKAVLDESGTVFDDAGDTGKAVEDGGDAPVDTAAAAHTEDA